MDFAIPALKIKQKDEILESCQRLEKVVEQEADSDTNWIWWV